MASAFRANRKRWPHWDFTTRRGLCSLLTWAARPPSAFEPELRGEELAVQTELDVVGNQRAANLLRGTRVSTSSKEVRVRPSTTTDSRTP